MTEVKHEASDSPWKQMTSQAAKLTNKQRLDPYSKVVLTEGSGPGPHLGLCGVDYAGGLAASNFEYQGHYNNLNESPGQSPYSISQPSPDSNGLANLNIASPSAAMANPPNVSDSDLVKMLGGIDGKNDSLNKYVKLIENIFQVMIQKCRICLTNLETSILAAS